MIKPNIDYDLSMAGFEDACQRLTEETGEKPVGIILGMGDAAYIGEILGAGSMDYIRVTVLPNFPSAAWMLYNSQDILFTPGAC